MFHWPDSTAVTHTLPSSFKQSEWLLCHVVSLSHMEHLMYTAWAHGNLVIILAETERSFLLAGRHLDFAQDLTTHTLIRKFSVVLLTQLQNRNRPSGKDCIIQSEGSWPADIYSHWQRAHTAGIYDLFPLDAWDQSYLLCYRFAYWIDFITLSWSEWPNWK